MLLKREGLPEENEIVLCTITNIYYHSVFCKLDEYDKTGMVHISEVAPGRIRNLRDYVKEGKKIICKVLKVKHDKGHIDLSLRRVNEMQRRNKNDMLKKELLAEAIVAIVAKAEKLKIEDLYARITDKLFENYSSLFESFEKVSKVELELTKCGIDKSLAQKLTEAIKQRIKPPIIHIKGEFKLISYVPDGVKLIADVMKKAQKTKGDYRLSYKGGGSYHLVITAEDYKAAETVLDKLTSTIIKDFTKGGGEASFERQEA